MQLKCVLWYRVTYKVHAVLGQPVEALEEEQQREERHKARREVVPEHGEGQAGLCHGVPRTLDQVLPGGKQQESAVNNGANGWEKRFSKVFVIKAPEWVWSSDREEFCVKGPALNSTAKMLNWLSDLIYIYIQGDRSASLLCRK